jgi:hypothetical protein
MARDIMAIRLDRTTRVRLAAVAKRRRQTPSAAARAALEQWLDVEERASSTRPYEAIADLVGCVQGPGDLSVRSGRRVAALLKARQRDVGR